jgi:hypothetical protein
MESENMNDRMKRLARTLSNLSHVKEVTDYISEGVIDLNVWVDFPNPYNSVHDEVRNDQCIFVFQNALGNSFGVGWTMGTADYITFADGLADEAEVVRTVEWMLRHPDAN